MLQWKELRLGNYILQKVNTRILPVQFGLQQIELLASGDDKNLYPVVLKAEVLEKCGFVENKDYALYPDAHEYKLVLPVIGSGNVELQAYIKNNGECFARAAANGIVCSNNIYQLHQLQNLCHALTGQELNVKL